MRGVKWCMQQYVHIKVNTSLCAQIILFGIMASNTLGSFNYGLPERLNALIPDRLMDARFIKWIPPPEHRVKRSIWCVNLVPFIIWHLSYVSRSVNNVFRCHLNLFGLNSDGPWELTDCWNPYELNSKPKLKLASVLNAMIRDRLRHARSAAACFIPATSSSPDHGCKEELLMQIHWKAASLGCSNCIHTNWQDSNFFTLFLIESNLDCDLFVYLSCFLAARGP